jgi:hypothetical protein
MFYQVLLHDPSEFPEVNKKGIFIGAGQEASIAVHAEVTESKLVVRAMTPERRKCLLKKETDTSLYKVLLSLSST